MRDAKATTGPSLPLPRPAPALRRPKRGARFKIFSSDAIRRFSPFLWRRWRRRWWFYGIGGFGVTPSRTPFFLTNFIGGGVCRFVMILLRMFIDTICLQKLYHVDFRRRYQYMGNSLDWRPPRFPPTTHTLRSGNVFRLVC